MKYRRPYENTAVPIARSQEAIRKIVLSNGGSGIAFVSQPPTEGFEAMISIEDKPYRIRITANLGEHFDEQNVRRVWRVLFFHLKALYEASSSGVLELRELILPFIVTKDGATVSQHLLPKLDAALAGRPERLLPSGKE